MLQVIRIEQRRFWRHRKKLERHPERYFYFQLAEIVGCTVSSLLENISSYEIEEWKAYFKIKERRAKKK